ncbi:hypothetical protein ACIQUL_36060 [Streptomyces sp. NPDC090303]|uniref:hypothetical protein n=1 Tax=Streptomyces sp. NPDC090303 TaxID=3365960 RepID=UPI003803F977
MIRRHLGSRTTLELCDDFEHLTKSSRRMPWAEQAISDALFKRNSNAWFSWQFEGNAFGQPMPHRFFGLI